MISLFRNFFQSKIGLPIFIGFLVLVALAFAASDISGSATFGGLTGDDKVAVVGGEPITSNEMSGAMNNALDRARDQNPTITMPQLVANDGLNRELELLIDRFAIGQFAQEYGLRAGENLVNSEILQIGAFRNVTGEFDQATYQAALRRQGITDAILRKDIADGLLAQQLLRPAFAAPQLPRAAARQYAALVLERRQGRIGLVPSSEYAPDGDPTDEQLNTFYSENRANFILPERRTIRFARFGADSVQTVAEPTDAQIAARYEADAAQYAAQERRAISTFVVPTEAAAQALVERIRAGLSLEAAAQQAGFNVSSGELLDRESMSSSTSFALAEAVFAESEGDVITPQRSQLGWYVARVDDVENTPARSLADVRGEIAAQIRREAVAAQLIDLSSQIEELVDTGTSLMDAATQFGLEVTAVPGVLADGRIFGTPGQTLNQAVRPVLETAFQMDEGEPQLAELVAGEQFLIFDVSDITESAAPPIAEVREEVTAAWRRNEGNRIAQQAANRILEDVRSGTPLAEAMRAENPSLTQVERIDLERRELLANPNQRVPTALILMFSMAQGSTKILEEENDLGWFLVDLDEIVVPEVANDNPILDQTQNSLAQALAGEYNAQFAAAVREEVGVERNEEAVEALRRQLAGEI
ncbi:peptidyl-prolyl isomerase [Erythrobacter sp. NAP1]|uniref:SurA N-terminal domain-containing protein n=1 Tax=Erythrobacter sp. NAP1 TaxID=237727 RepID=UPI0000686D05|nr:SurA N-terminal domain-containing protein [Erythrobacter sp. NAP1]EAQ30254.1 peptidyl-prolyl isomerase [Erythrobacter sp. NAP1]